MTHRRTNSGTKSPCLFSLCVYSFKDLLKLYNKTRIKMQFGSVWLIHVLLQGLFGEYIELLVQFGYLSLFSCVYPLTAVLLLINNLTEIRSDAYKICNLFRKPFSPLAANMGVWQVSRSHNAQQKWEWDALIVSPLWQLWVNSLCHCLVFQLAFEVLSFVSVVSNCWLLILSPRLRELCQGGEMSSTNFLLLAVLLEVQWKQMKMLMISKSYITTSMFFLDTFFNRVCFCSMCSSWSRWFWPFWSLMNRIGSRKRKSI